MCGCFFGWLSGRAEVWSCGVVFAVATSQFSVLNFCTMVSIGCRLPPGGRRRINHLYSSSLIRRRDLRKIFNGAKHIIPPSNADLYLPRTPLPHKYLRNSATRLARLSPKGGGGSQPRPYCSPMDIPPPFLFSLLLHACLSRAPVNVEDLFAPPCRACIMDPP